MISNDVYTYYSLTVHYDGYFDLKKRTLSDKKRLIKIIQESPSLSYSEYAEALGVTKNHIAARIRYLIKYGYIKRDEEGKLVILKTDIK